MTTRCEYTDCSFHVNLLCNPLLFWCRPHFAGHTASQGERLTCAVRAGVHGFCAGKLAPPIDNCQEKPSGMSYHIRNVPAFSTIEMSPGCGFTMPRKKPVFSCAASLVATDDCWPEPVWVWGMGARGKGQRPFLCPSREKRTRARERPNVVRDSV